MTKIALTIAGLDPSGGAGVIADIRTFAAFGCFPTAAVSSITFQNTQKVFGSESQSAETVRGQVIPILDDYTVDALKTGMLPTREVIEETAGIISDRKLKNFVVDPVVRSTSGFDLIDNAALSALIEKLFPLADLITPNIPEAERISGVAIQTERDIHDAAGVMHGQGARNVLIKGGHFETAENYNGVRTAKDFLFIDGELTILEAQYHNTTATHGTGCTLSAAITALLALGKELGEAVAIAKQFVNVAIRTAPMIGRGNSPINIRTI